MRMQLPDSAYDTYGIVMPEETHFRRIRCEEAITECTSEIAPGMFCPEKHCGPWAHGWKTILDVSIPEQRDLARLLVKNEGNRHWTARQTGTLAEFTFPPGQQCFKKHKVTIDRPAVFTLKQGKEFRAIDQAYVERGAIVVPGARQVRGEEWLERFGENQQILKEIEQRG